MGLAVGAVAISPCAAGLMFISKSCPRLQFQPTSSLKLALLAGKLLSSIGQTKMRVVRGASMGATNCEEHTVGIPFV